MIRVSSEVIEILMRRDKISREDAKEEVRECNAALADAVENGEDPEDIIQDMLGLEPDYLEF